MNMHLSVFISRILEVLDQLEDDEGEVLRKHRLHVLRRSISVSGDAYVGLPGGQTGKVDDCYLYSFPRS